MIRMYRSLYFIGGWKKMLRDGELESREVRCACFEEHNTNVFDETCMQSMGRTWNRIHPMNSRRQGRVLSLGRSTRSGKLGQARKKGQSCKPLHGF